MRHIYRTKVSWTSEVTYYRILPAPDRAIYDHVFENVFITLESRYKFSGSFRPEIYTRRVFSVVLQTEVGLDQLKRGLGEIWLNQGDFSKLLRVAAVCDEATELFQTKDFELRWIWPKSKEYMFFLPFSLRITTRFKLTSLVQGLFKIVKNASINHQASLHALIVSFKMKAETSEAAYSI